MTHFVNNVYRHPLNEKGIEQIYDIVHNKSDTTDSQAEAIADQFKEYYDKEQFSNYIAEVKNLHSIGKKDNMKYGFELQPRKIPEYYQACEESAAKCDLDDETINKQTKATGYQKRGLSEIMGNLLTLGKFSPYQKTIKKLEKDRTMLHHRSMILKMKKLKAKKIKDANSVSLKTPKRMNDINWIYPSNIQ
jgi:hypothetical protein